MKRHQQGRSQISGLCLVFCISFKGLKKSGIQIMNQQTFLSVLLVEIVDPNTGGSITRNNRL
jgi:hypothetical protein